MRGLVPRWLALCLVVSPALFGFHASSRAAADCGFGPGRVKDEALCVGRTPESLTGADEDYFRDMDYGVTKNPAGLAAALAPYKPGITPGDALKAAVVGRDNWIVWTGGNDRLWSFLAYQSLGGFDLLKILSDH